MKAVVYHRYGPPDVLQLKEIDRPQPKDNELLVKVHYTSVNRTDNATTKAIPFIARLVTGLFRPRQTTPGSEFSGEVVECGNQISQFRIGDRIFGFNDMGTGAQAEYLVVKEAYVTSIPKGIDYRDAVAGIEGFHYAMNFINKVNIEPRMKVLVYGASGAIGSAALQLLKAMDVWVTAVCGTRNLELMKTLGADKVVDYTQADFIDDTLRYDYVFDTVGKVSFFRCWRLLKHNGAYISSDLGYLGQNIFLPLITPLLRPLIGKHTRSPFPKDIPATLKQIRSLMLEERFHAVIDREYPLEEIVEAYRYVEKGHKTGSVLIRVSQ